jgi:hypothetical protein
LNSIVLDDFPPWSIYIPALFVLLVFLLAVASLLRALRGAREPAGDRRGRSRPIRLQWVFVFASGAALWFLFTSMFVRFHAMAVDPLTVRLDYLWPQPSALIPRTEIVEVRLSRGARTCGHLEVATREEVYFSVNFKRCKEAETILKELPIHDSR